MKTTYTAQFEIGIHDVAANGIRHGWFEHGSYGDEYGGGLWFENDVLVDYDSPGGYLPKEVLNALEAEGFDVEDMRPENL